MASVKTISTSQLSDLNQDNFLSYIQDKNDSLFVGSLKFSDWRKQIGKNVSDVLTKELLLKKQFVEKLNDSTKEALFITSEAGLNLFPIELKSFDWNKVTIFNPKKGNGNLPLDCLFVASLSAIEGVIILDNGKKIYHINLGRNWAYSLTEILSENKLLLASKSEGGKVRSKFKETRSEENSKKVFSELINTVVKFETAKVEFETSKSNLKKGKYKENNNWLQLRNQGLLGEVLPTDSNKVEIAQSDTEKLG
jgi:hypothetical protein